MSVRNCLQICLGLMIGLVGLLPAPTALAFQNQKTNRAEAEFYRGYYLQHQDNNIRDAVRAYKNAIKLGADKNLRATIDQEIGALQEDLASADFAKLMPESAIAYVEINKAANHVEKVAKLLGLTGRQFSPSDDRVRLRIDNEISIPSDFQISPALLRELKKTGGAGVAITGIRQNGPPVDGVAVIHAGDSDLITGLLETGVQLAPAENQIGGYPTFNIDNEVWIVKTDRMIIVSTQTELITNCLSRISDSGRSLADVESFQAARNKNKDSALFAYVSPQSIMKKYGRMFEGEMAIARMVMDLDHMQHVSGSLAATDLGIRARFGFEYAEDHNSFGYGLVRTAPLSRKALSNVPSGSAAVVGLGLNPKMVLAAQAAGHQHLSALDIGREFFANIEEVAVFVMPTVSEQNREIPNVGVVIASADIEKSESLWNQVLTLPSKIKIEDGPSVKETTVGGVTAHEYTFPDDDIPAIMIARVGDDAMVVGTRGAVAAAISAHATDSTLANDERAAAFWNAGSKFTSKAAFVNVSQALNLAAQMEGGSDAREMKMAATVLDDLSVTVVVNEAPAEFEVRTDVLGLPIFENVIKTFAKMQSSAQQVRHEPRTDRRADYALETKAETAAAIND